MGRTMMFFHPCAGIYLCHDICWTSQALTDTLGVIVGTWEGLWGIRADRSPSD